MILDLFAGHGVGVALSDLSLREYPVEVNTDVNETRKLNGMALIAQEDAWDISKTDGLTFKGMWGSPPCQMFSIANQTRKNITPSLIKFIEKELYHDMNNIRALADKLGDDRYSLVLTPMTYIQKHNPDWIILEQVPGVLKIWEAMRLKLEEQGYHVWTGKIDASYYGVPQSRIRAYLIASKKSFTLPKEESQSVIRDFIDNEQEGLISNYSSMGSSTNSIRIPNNRSPRGYRTVDKPSMTITTQAFGNKWFPSMRNLSIEEALVLQGYPKDFKLAGTKSSKGAQIGNAVPPTLARKLIEVVM